MSFLSSLVFFAFLPIFLLAEVSCPTPTIGRIVNGRCVFWDFDSTHAESAQYCKQRGGNLATIKNKEDNDAFSKYIYNLNNGATYFYIGVFCFNTNGTITCLNDDGSGLVSFDNFASGFPKNRAKFQCVYTLASKEGGNKWMTNDCSNKYWAICEVPTTIRDASCDGYNYNGYCYTPSYWLPDVTDTSFPKAQAICKARGSNMVSIHSQGELDFVSGLLGSIRPFRITLGAQAFQPHVFNWVDGSEFDFNYRNPYDNFTGNCLAMQHGDTGSIHDPAQNKLWTEINCQTFNSFVCKKKIENPGLLKPEPVSRKEEMIHYDLSDPSNCNNTLLMAPGTITSFGYGSSPLPGVQCSYNIATLGSWQVAIFFTNISIGSTIKIEDGFGYQLASIGDTYAPVTIETPGNTAVLTYNSVNDAKAGKSGFTATIMQF